MRSTILAVFAAICWGLAPLAAKIALENVSTLMGLGIRSTLTAGLVIGWLVVSGRYRFVGADLKGPSLGWFMLEALLATVVGDAFYFYALKHGQPGQVNLIMASSPLITLLFAVLVLDEPLTALKVAGGLLIIFGLFLVAL